MHYDTYKKSDIFKKELIDSSNYNTVHQGIITDYRNNTVHQGITTDYRKEDTNTDHHRISEYKREVFVKMKKYEAQPHAWLCAILHIVKSLVGLPSFHAMGLVRLIDGWPWSWVRLIDNLSVLRGGFVSHPIIPVDNMYNVIYIYI